MKIYVSCDMEGTAGVCSWEQVDARNNTPEYSIYRRYMTGEVRAAIEGARAAGASEVLVNDSHGPMRNLLFDQLPDDLRVIFGNRKPFSMVQGLDRTF
ncbi:MAG: M55 family metallopeptidase, partial [Vulcanimicrobiaceae bacterium]